MRTIMLAGIERFKSDDHAEVDNLPRVTRVNMFITPILEVPLSPIREKHPICNPQIIPNKGSLCANYVVAIQKDGYLNS